jgi:hypothetical protein
MRDARCPSLCWYGGEPYGDGWDDDLGDFHPFRSPCAHPGRGTRRIRRTNFDPETGRPVKLQGGRAVYCHYHASPMWVKRRQRAKAKWAARARNRSVVITAASFGAVLVTGSGPIWVP